MNEYEKIIKIVVTNIATEKMKYEDAVEILTSLFRIAESNRTSIDKDFKPYVTWTNAPSSLPESLLKQATTLPYGENENNVEV